MALQCNGVCSPGFGLCSRPAVDTEAAAASSGTSVQPVAQLACRGSESRSRSLQASCARQWQSEAGPRSSGGDAGWGWKRSELLGKDVKAPDYGVRTRYYAGGRPRPASVRVGAPARATLDAELSEQVSGHGRQLRPFQIAMAAGLLVAGEKALGVGISQWQAVPSGLPAATVGMLILTGALTAVDAASPDYSKRIVSFFMPASEQFQRWMPLFYTPPLVMLPVALQKVTVEQGGKLLFLVGTYCRYL